MYSLSSPLRSPLLFVTFGIAVLAWISFRLYTHITLEDALITYRYAGNIAVGDGFVFNLGERVLGTTTPLLTLILGLFGSIFGVGCISFCSNLMAMIAALGAGIFTYSALRRLNFAPAFSLFTTGAYLFHSTTLWSVTGGMETQWVVFFMAWSFWALISQKYWTVAVSCGLLVLTRIDGLVWCSLLFFWILVKSKREFLKSAAVFAAVLAPWVIFAALYFHSLLPNSIAAKEVIGNGQTALGMSAFVSLFRWAANRFAALSPFGTLIGLVFFALGVIAAFRGNGRNYLKILALFPLLFLIVFFVGRAPRFPWYFVPVAWSAIVVGIIGLFELRAKLASMLRLPARVVSLATLIFVSIFAGFVVYRDFQTAELHRSYQINEDGLRKVVGEWLNEHTPLDATVAMEAIGYQGHYSHRRVIDLAGLVSPSVVEIRRNTLSNAEAFFEVINRLKPDYVVLRSYEVDRNESFHGGKLFETPAQKAYFRESYQEVKRFAAPLPVIWGDLAYLTVYSRTRN